MTYLKIFGIALGIFFAIDMVWLTLVAKNLYAKFLGAFMGPVKWLPAILFYVLFVLGLAFFVIMPAVDKDSLWYVILAGLFFGFVSYATYDLTNLATIKDWPWQITLIDLAWGSTLGAMVSTITFLIVR